MSGRASRSKRPPKLTAAEAREEFGRLYRCALRVGDELGDEQARRVIEGGAKGADAYYGALLMSNALAFRRLRAARG